MKSLKKLLKYVHPSLKGLYTQITISFLLQIIGQIVSLAFIPLLYQRVIDSLDVSFIDNPDIYRYAFLLIGAFTIVSLTFRVSGYLMAWIQKQMVSRLNSRVFDNFINRDYHFYLDNLSGSLVAKFSKFSTAVYKIYDMLNFQMVSPLVGLIAMFVILSTQSWYLVFLFAGWVVLYLSISGIWSKLRAKTSLARTRSFSQLTGAVSDGITNIMNVKSFAKEDQEAERFEIANQTWKKLLYKDWITFVHSLSVSSILNISFQGGSLLLGLYLWKEGVLTTGFIVLLILYTRQLIDQVRTLGRSLPNFSAALSDTREVIEIIEKPLAVSNLNIKDLIPGSNTITFENVSFTYPYGDHVFENFNLTINSGERIGIVGKSGSGKTTLVKLLLRFYDLDNGVIKIGDNVISDLSQKEYRNHFITFVPQETTLFHRSLRENIMYTNIKASEELFDKAVKASYVDEFVSKFENGYDTKVGERGIRLSGGQRQRVGIARAMLKKDAPILIMDEATSALDSESEKYIQDSFEELSKDRTTIVIAHRLSTIQKMDRILVMENGEVVEDGSHTELLKQQGVYHKLWNSQVGGFISE